MKMLRALLVPLALALGGVLIPPVVAPSVAIQARAEIIGYTTDGVLVYTWYWQPVAGMPNGGYWVLINVTPAIGL